MSTAAGEAAGDIELAPMAAASAADGTAARARSPPDDQRREEERRSAEDFEMLTGSMGFAPEDAARALAAANGELARAADLLVSGGAERAAERANTQQVPGGEHAQEHPQDVEYIEYL